MNTYLFEIHYKLNDRLNNGEIRGINHEDARRQFLLKNPGVVIISCSRIGN